LRIRSFQIRGLDLRFNSSDLKSNAGNEQAEEQRLLIKAMLNRHHWSKGLEPSVGEGVITSSRNQGPDCGLG
jgi:hypothetical protein